MEGAGPADDDSMMTARAIAFRALIQVERADAFLNLALDAGLKAAGNLPRPDAALATELTYGVSRRALALDAALARHSRRPLEKLETAVHVALRLGAYQLLYLDRIPPHAAVDETVKLAKNAGLGRAAGFLNAVLRRLAEAREIPLPEAPLERISVETSHPLWLVERWTARLGIEEAAALCRADNEAPPVCVRVHGASRDEVIASLAREDVRAQPTALSPLGLWLEDPGPLARLKTFQDGLFQVQDEAAQLVSFMAEARPGMRVLDACAAPGGKACHLAAQVGPKGEVFALDVHPRKLQKIEEEARRLGVGGSMRLRSADAARPLPFPERSFDRILLDAPCSGLGTLRRHPELRYRRTAADVARLAEGQRALWKNLLAYLKPGGALVYAVCSPEPEEGAQHLAELEAAGLSLERPRAEGVPWDQVLDAKGALTTWPHRHRADAFFAARMIAGPHSRTP